MIVSGVYVFLQIGKKIFRAFTTNIDKHETINVGYPKGHKKLSNMSLISRKQLDSKQTLKAGGVMARHKKSCLKKIEFQTASLSSLHKIDPGRILTFGYGLIKVKV
jgi:hypothetical protein